MGEKKDKIMPGRGFIILILFFLTIPVYANVDFKADYFNKPQEITPYRFQGSKDNNGDGKPDEMYYKEGNKELLIEDTDYDGKVNRVGYTENGVLIKMEEDIDQDGEWDYRAWYKDGKFERLEKAPEIEKRFK